MMGDPRSLGFWAKEFKGFWSDAGAETAMKVLLSGGMGGSNLLPTDIKPLVNWDAFNEAALIFLRAYQGEVFNEISATTKKQVIKAIDDWVLAGEPLPALEAKLAGTFGDARAQSIASTEVTRIYAMGNQMSWQSTGVIGGKRWQTARDERVCPICRPLHNRVIPLEGNFMLTLDDMSPAMARSGEEFIYHTPPAHPNCRCWMTPIVDEAAFREEIRGALTEEEIEEKVTAPVGRLSDTVTYRESQISPHFDRSMNALDDVFQKGQFDLGDVKLSGYSGRGEGKFNPETGKIQINRSSIHKEFSTIHEVGHATDYRILNREFGIQSPTASLGSSFSMEATPMDDFWDAIDNSDAIKELQSRKDDDPDGIGYLLDVREVYARAFSQYVAETSGDAVLLEQLNAIRENAWYPEQWTVEDFASIKKAMDSMFKLAGLLG